MKLEVQKEWAKRLALWMMVLGCTIIMITLCFDKGMDFDEAYSYSTVHDNALWEIPGKIIDAYDTDIPLWYCALKVWITLFGESWFAYKLFAVMGNLATMALGATVVRRNWGYKTASLFILAAGLAPALLHIGINVRMYSWTVFLTTAGALAAYGLVEKPGSRRNWLLFALITVTAFFCHYFTAISFLFIYLYLFIEFLKYDRKSIWKIFLCGIAAAIPFLAWSVKAGMFHFVEVGEPAQTITHKMNWYKFWNFAFDIRIDHNVDIGCFFVAVVFFCFVLFRKRFERREWVFVLLCLSILFLSYLAGGVAAGKASHFFTPRHTMHALALLWLGIAIVLPRVNKGVYVFGMLFLGGLCLGSYRKCYANEYTTTPYIEETLAFVEDNMEPGDIVIYNTEIKFDMLYRCYMPQQQFVHLSEITDIQELAGKRVWFFLCNPTFFTEEDQKKYGITYEDEGHFGFQIIADCTDFDLLRVDIAGN